MNKLLEVPPEELNEEENSCKDITSETWKSSAKVYIQLLGIVFDIHNYLFITL